MTGRRRRRRKQLLKHLKRTREYWNLKEEAPDRTLWRMRIAKCYGPAVRQTPELMDDVHDVYLYVLLTVWVLIQ
jgi:hypothetical protein